MRTADVILHRPTGETWVVAYVDEQRGEVTPCGWPFCFARLEDCDMKKAASDDESEQLLQELAAMTCPEHDFRRSWAQRVLAARDTPSESKAEP